MALQIIQENAVQVRVGQQRGQTKYLAFRKHGGRAAALAKARTIEAEMLAARGGRYGRVRGIRQSNNVSGIPGIRLEWREYGGDWMWLYVVGNYTNHQGKPSAFAYSVDKHGLEGALQLGLAKRERHGVPPLPLAKALQAIQAHYRAMTK